MACEEKADKELPANGRGRAEAAPRSATTTVENNGGGSSSARPSSDFCRRRQQLKTRVEGRALRDRDLDGKIKGGGLLPSQQMQLTRIWPHFRCGHKSGAYWIHPHIFPFFTVTFTPAQLGIPIIALPDRFIACLRPISGYLIAPAAYPCLQSAFQSGGSAEKMNMVRHDYIPPHQPEISRPPCIHQQLLCA